jgi:hypothetical protein
MLQAARSDHAANGRGLDGDTVVQRQLLLPSNDNYNSPAQLSLDSRRTLSRAPAKGACDGQDHGCSGEAFVSTLGGATAAGERGDQDRHGSQNGTEVSKHAAIAQRDRGTPRLADTPRCVRPRVGGSGGSTGAGAGLAGQNVVRVAAGTTSRSVREWPGADAATAGAAVAGHGGARQGSLLFPGTLPGTPVRLGLYLDERPGRDPRRSAVRPPGLSLRADVLELGVGDDLLLGELRESE